jgi:hypothetical protein
VDLNKKSTTNVWRGQSCRVWLLLHVPTDTDNNCNIFPEIWCACKSIFTFGSWYQYYVPSSFLLLSVNQGCWLKILTAMLIIRVVLHNSLAPSTNFMHIQFLLISGCLHPRGKTRASAVLIKQWVLLPVLLWVPVPVLPPIHHPPNHPWANSK